MSDMMTCMPFGQLMDWVQADGPRLPLEFEVRRGDALILDVFAQASPDGGFVLSFTDVTAERAALEALSRAKETLEARVIERTLELEDALAYMVQCLGGAQAQPTAEATDCAQNFIIKNAIAYIEEHYAEKLTLTDVADKVYVSQWHLSKLIAKNTNQSFSDLLNGVRIAHAKELLKNPALKIWEISEAVGFADVTHFSRIFKKLENKSANEYRNTALR